MEPGGLVFLDHGCTNSTSQVQGSGSSSNAVPVSGSTAPHSVDDKTFESGQIAVSTGIFIHLYIIITYYI